MRKAVVPVLCLVVGLAVGLVLASGDEQRSRRDMGKWGETTAELPVTVVSDDGQGGTCFRLDDNGHTYLFTTSSGSGPKVCRVR